MKRLGHIARASSRICIGLLAFLILTGAVVTGGTSAINMDVDVTSKAGRFSPFDLRGKSRAPKATYRATTAAAQSGVVVAPASAAPFACIYGSSTKTIEVQRMYISGGTLTAVAYASYVVAKYSTAVTGGTATALTATPMDSSLAASTASLVNVYTAAPTAGTLVGTISAKRTLLQATTAAAAGAPDVIEFDFRTLGSENHALYLRGTLEGACVNFGAAPASAVTLSFSAEWTEETEPT